jgi:acetolactate synthase-1/2/3 large subunit
LEKNTLGEILIKVLEQYDVEFIFGIPGVHTVELYRNIVKSKIRHITARHEQSVGFMADGYARISGKPGVCFVITGPGVTNILTAMAQARSDSIPMLVISGVNDLTKNNKKRAPLHELPDQAKLIKQVAIASYTVKKSKNIVKVLHKAFLKMTLGRPGPVHIQIPIEVMTKSLPMIQVIKPLGYQFSKNGPLETQQASSIINSSSNPCIILGGGARNAKEVLSRFSETLEAPTFSTVNARDLLGHHSLHIPASPSLKAVRDLLRGADLVIALGTEMGQTDYDMYEDGLFPNLKNLIRVDIDKNQLKQSPVGAVNLRGDVKEFCESILQTITPKKNGNIKEVIKIYKKSIQHELPPQYAPCQLLISTIIKTLPDAILVGDSTQPTYSGNLYCEISEKNRWFNSATGFGTLGYAPPAAIGASLACPEKPVICIVGDGGLQFSIAEFGTARDELVPILFLVWNNREYKEIRTYMQSQGINPIGISPIPPKLELIAQAYGMEFRNVTSSTELSDLLTEFQNTPIPLIVEVIESKFTA